MNEETQSIAIAEMRKDITYLIQLNENWNKKTDQMRDSYNGKFAMQGADIKGLYDCNAKMELKIKEFEPTHTFVKDLQGRILTGFIALLALLGAIIYGAVELLNNKKSV
jgi:hypothetical protein